MEKILFLFLFITSAHAQTSLEKELHPAKGYQPELDANFFQNHPWKSFTESAVGIPARADLEGLTGEIENQGNCGSCWAFSLTSALRGTFATAGRDPGRLSFNYLLNCTPFMGCNGGAFSAAGNLKRPKGAPNYGVDGDYVAQQSACLRGQPAASAIRSYRLGPIGRFSSFKDIAYVVGVLKRPVVIDIAAHGEWDKYKSGVFSACNENSIFKINHMVVIEGYDCENSVNQQGQCKFDSSGNLPNGVGVWKIRNSWGRNWGERGYVRMKATTADGARCQAAATTALYFEI